MITTRAIPCLLLRNNNLVKTFQFGKDKYVGDPLNAVKIFNEKEVDELFLIDIDASVKKLPPNYKLIESIASECFMPLGYGGGVKTIEQMRTIFSLGVEKISINSAFLDNPNLVKEAASEFGSQSIIVSIDIKKSFFRKKNLVTTLSGKKVVKAFTPVDYAIKAQELGAGEILINDMDRDGMQCGYNIELIREITSKLNIPVIALGGAGKLEDLTDVVLKGGASAAAAGSLFVFKGIHKAVLINYPESEKLRQLFSS